MIDSISEADAAEERHERGATLVEYSLLIALIAIACFVAVQYLGQKTGGGLTDSGSSIFVTGS
jgi:Flp pilus assembly pilin Flp